MRSFRPLAVAAVLLVALAPASTSAVPATTTPPTGEISVMTRNLYLGADVGLALDLLPDIAAAAQAMWTQVAATDFTSRVDDLARDVVERQPMVVGLQEATVWECLDPDGQPVTVFDFTSQLLDELARQGVPYVIAEHGGQTAFSPGYAIPPIGGLTVVSDPATLQSVVGSDAAACGFRIGDVLAVRADLADEVTAVGTTTFAATTLVGGILEVQRGYAWADLALPDGAVRFATTHLESLWTPDAEPASAAQARELIAELEAVASPVVAMGDFNIDPRDPRPEGAPNPGGQPEVSPFCPDRSCSAYWLMVGAGFVDAGPDATDPANFTWGSDGSLAGPSLDRLDAALELGNPLGFTDRLDYVFVRGDLEVTSAEVIGGEWPDGPTVWTCTAPEQVDNTRQAAERLGVDVPSTGRCFATDHLGLSVTLTTAGTTAGDGAVNGGNGGDPTNVGVVLAVVAAAVVVIGGVAMAIVTRRARRGSNPDTSDEP